MALEKGKVISKHIGGEVPDNPFGRAESEGGVRRSLVKRGEGKGRIPVGKGLDRDFLLVVKSPAMFSALLPVLVKRFPAYAIVRNPLSVLASWNSIDHKPLGGHAPAAERYDGRLREALASITDDRERQLYILSWWYGRFDRDLPDDSVIRYEDIVGSGGRALSAVTPAAGILDEPLLSRNRNPLYDRERMLRLGERLLQTEGAYWRFYARESVEELLTTL